MESSYCVLQTTVADSIQAKQLAGLLVEEKLAACVSIEPEVCSCYRWQGKIESEEEIPLQIKTKKEHLKAIEKTFQDKHPYDCPQFIVLDAEIMTSNYKAWFMRQLVKEI